MTRTANDHLNAARASLVARDWTNADRHCAIAMDKAYDARMGHAFMNSIDRVWAVARAQIDTLRRAA